MKLPPYLKINSYFIIRNKKISHLFLIYYFEMEEILHFR